MPGPLSVPDQSPETGRVAGCGGCRLEPVLDLSRAGLHKDILAEIIALTYCHDE